MIHTKKQLLEAKLFNDFLYPNEKFDENVNKYSTFYTNWNWLITVLKKFDNLPECQGNPEYVSICEEIDLSVTRRFVQAALLLDMQLIDHIILAGDQHYSFADEGML